MRALAPEQRCLEIALSLRRSLRRGSHNMGITIGSAAFTSALLWTLALLGSVENLQVFMLQAPQVTVWICVSVLWQTLTVLFMKRAKSAVRKTVLALAGFSFPLLLSVLFFGRSASGIFIALIPTSILIGIATVGSIILELTPALVQKIVSSLGFLLILCYLAMSLA